MGEVQGLVEIQDSVLVFASTIIILVSIFVNFELKDKSLIPSPPKKTILNKDQHLNQIVFNFQTSRSQQFTAKLL